MSSSAQLALLPWLLGWDEPQDRTTLAAGLHAGSCLGLAWALRSDLRSLDRRTAGVLAATSAPAAVAGLLAADAVEARFGRPPQLAALLAGAGAVLWAADLREERVAVVGAHQAASAALAQVAALVPGVSRAGATLTVLRAGRIERGEAVRFSLLMSLPITAGAAGLTLLRAQRPPWRELVAGVPVAAVAAAVAATAQSRRPGRSLRAAALYRLGLAAVVAVRLRSERHRKGEA